MRWGPQCCRSPCRLGVEATWAHILSPRYSWSFRCHPFSPYPCSKDFGATSNCPGCSPLLEASIGPNQASDQGQRADGAKDKGKGKGTKPPSKAKDAAKARKLKLRQRKQKPRLKKLILRLRTQRPRLKKLILRPRMLLPLNRARKKTFLLQRPRLST